MQKVKQWGSRRNSVGRSGDEDGMVKPKPKRSILRQRFGKRTVRAELRLEGGDAGLRERCYLRRLAAGPQVSSLARDGR